MLDRPPPARLARRPGLLIAADGVGLYLAPPRNAVVVRVDRKRLAAPDRRARRP